MQQGTRRDKWMGLSCSWAWQPKYKGKTIITITIYAPTWNIIPYFDLGKHTETLMDDKLKRFIQDNQSYCIHGINSNRKGTCKPNRVCAGGVSKQFSAKNFTDFAAVGTQNQRII